VQARFRFPFAAYRSISREKRTIKKPYQELYIRKTGSQMESGGKTFFFRKKEKDEKENLIKSVGMLY
jgi:hypothetical protein